MRLLRGAHQPMRHLPTLFVLAAASLLCACDPAPPTAPPPPQSAPAAAPAPDPMVAARAQARVYLDRGLLAMQRDFLTTPASDNAFLWFQKALSIVPDYKPALDGLERIVERYLQMTNEALMSDDFGRVRLFIERAKSVLPDYPQIERLESQATRLEKAERKTLKLDRRALERRAPMLMADLAVFGREARREGALVRIFAPSDSLGRWVYEQLSRSSGEGRIRADIVSSPPYRVQILLLEP